MDNNVSILLLTLVGNENKTLILFFCFVLPYLYNFSIKIYYKIKNYFNKSFSITVVQKYHEGKNINNNMVFKALCWYTENFSELQKSLICEEHVTKSNENIGNKRLKGKSIPIYLSLKSFDIPYKNINIEIRFSDLKTEKHITLKCTSSIKALQEFVKETNEKYEQYFYADLDVNKIYVFEWEHGKYNNDGDFQHKEISVFKNFKNIYLPENIQKEIKYDIDKFLESKEFYRENGIPYKRGYLLYGPPGTGKNSLCYAIANEYKMNLYKLNVKDILSGASGKFNIKQTIQKIPPSSILFIDEIDINIYNDRLVKDVKMEEGSIQEVKRKISNNETEKKLPMSTLMEILDGYDSLHGCIVILTTNHIEHLDPALIRPGRIDLHFLLDKLGYLDIQKTIKRFTGFDISVSKNLKITSSVLLNQILLPHRDNFGKIEELIKSFY